MKRTTILAAIFAAFLSITFTAGAATREATSVLTKDQPHCPIFATTTGTEVKCFDSYASEIGFVYNDKAASTAAADVEQAELFGRNSERAVKARAALERAIIASNEKRSRHRTISRARLAAPGNASLYPGCCYLGLSAYDGAMGVGGLLSIYVNNGSCTGPGPGGETNLNLLGDWANAMSTLGPFSYGTLAGIANCGKALWTDNVGAAGSGIYYFLRRPYTLSYYTASNGQNMDNNVVGVTLWPCNDAATCWPD